MKSLKEKVNEWLHDNGLFFVEDRLTCGFYLFQLEGFSDEPEIYMEVTQEGIQFGYIGVKWDGHMPVEVKVKKSFIALESLQSIHKQYHEDEIVNHMMKAIHARKRQYRKCQYCGKKVATEHRFDKNTCHTCATEYLGVVY